MSTEPPNADCYNDPRFTTTHPADIAAALTICGTCTVRACVPILRDLQADRTSAALIEGVWDGRYYSQNTTAAKRKKKTP